MAAKALRRVAAALSCTFIILFAAACVEEPPAEPKFGFSFIVENSYLLATDVSAEDILAYEPKYPDAMNDHYKNQLSQNDLYIYNAVSYAVDNGYPRIYIPEEYYTKEKYNVNEIITFYSCDSPFLEHNYTDNNVFAFNVMTTSGGRNNGKKTYYFDLPHIDENSLAEKKAAYDKAASIIKKLPKTKTEEEKALCIYDAVSELLSFADESKYDYTRTAIYEALCGSHTAICDGYADTLMMAFNLAGIPTFAVEGFNGKNVGHVLDIAKINGKYYYFDASADNSPIKLGFEPRFYCFMDDEYAHRDFTPLSFFDGLVPKAKDKALELHVDVVAKKGDEKAVEKAADIVNKNGSVTVFLSGDFDDDDYENTFGTQMLKYAAGPLQMYRKNGVTAYTNKKD